MSLAPLAALALIAVTLPAPSAAPSPAPSEAPLREIGSVRATTPFCRKMIETAVNAVDLTLTDDAKIVDFERVLRTLDFDSNQLVKHKSTDELRKRYVSLRATAVEGERALKAFKAEAKDAPDAEQRAALVKFADALAGALYRQQKIADNLGGYLAKLDSSEPLSDDDRAELQLKHDIEASNLIYMTTNPIFGQPEVPEQLSHSAKRAADELEERAKPINKDEDDAANRIDLAFKHC